jgi:predicted P-loop ATPase
MSNTFTSNINLKQSKNTQISFYANLTDRTNNLIAINEIFEQIKTGSNYKHIINKIRKGDSSLKDQLKKQLPCVTISGVFENNRKYGNLLFHTGFIQIDIDKVPNLDQALTKLKNDKFSFAVFISPSGTGIKIIVKIPARKDSHNAYFLKLKSYYKKNYNISIDEQCKDVTRLMFLSYDPDLYFNEQSYEFVEADNENYLLYNQALNEVNTEMKFEIGNRNSFIFSLARTCRSKNVDKNFLITELNKKYSSSDFNENEIFKTVSSAYSATQNVTENIKGLSTLKRAEVYLENKYEIRLNKVSAKIEMRENGTNNQFNEINEYSLYRELQHNEISISLNKITTLLQSDFVESYDPFLAYFESLAQWHPDSNCDYIKDVCSYLPVKNEVVFIKHFKKMLVRCIACALDNKIFNKQVFVLIGEKQNTGKSTFCRWLCPEVLSDYFTEYVNTDKDGLIILSTSFLINLDELAIFTKAEINVLKSFISKDKINVRLPYAKRSSAHYRRASFIGSTNSDEFLTDETGSVRWLCFELDGDIDFNYKNIDINDVWRQAYWLYKNGFEFQLTPNEIKELEETNSKYFIQTEEYQLINKYLAPSSIEEGEFMDATEVLKYLSAELIGVKLNINRIGKAMKKLGFSKESKYMNDKKYSQKGYYVKKIKST